MKIRAVIIDFDGTLITEDITDLVCELVGKKEESRELTQLFHDGKLKGLQGIVRRINFLRGVSLGEIRSVVAEKDFLRPGAYELFRFLKQKGIISIVASGAIVPLLEIYQEKLGIDYLVGSRPIIKDGRLVSISEAEYPGPAFKVLGSKAILDQHGIPNSSVVAIGDSPADKGIFDMAAKSIAIDPKSGIERFADYTINDDLSKAIPILQSLMK